MFSANSEGTIGAYNRTDICCKEIKISNSRSIQVIDG